MEWSLSSFIAWHTFFMIVFHFLHWHCLAQCIASHCITKLIYLDLGSIHEAITIVVRRLTYFHCDSNSLHPLALFNTGYCFSLHYKACLSRSRIYSFSERYLPSFFAWLRTVLMIAFRFIHWHCLIQCVASHCIAKLTYLDLGSIHEAINIFVRSFHCDSLSLHFIDAAKRRALRLITLQSLSILI